MRPANISNQRILAEVKKLNQEKLTYLNAAPLPDDLYTWHFTFQGPENTEFHEGLYHGQILLPYEYPFKPPDIIFMNKNGRFETNTKICLTITQYHPEEWNSAWTIRTMLEAVMSLFTENMQGVGSLSSSAESRRFLAQSSQAYVCDKCGSIKDLLAPRAPEDKQKSEPKAENEIPTKAERKKSEVAQPTQPQLPILEAMFSEKLNMKPSEWRKEPLPERFQPRNRSTYPNIPKMRQQVEHQPHRRPNQGDGESDGPHHQRIYIQDTNREYERQVAFKPFTAQIAHNMQVLSQVEQSIRWTD